MFHINLSKERYCNGCHKVRNVRHFNLSRFFKFKESKRCLECLYPIKKSLFKPFEKTA